MSAANASEFLPSSVEAQERVAPRRTLWDVRAWMAIAAWIAITDWSLYRGGGFAGWALALAFLPIMSLVAIRWQTVRKGEWVALSAMIFILAARLVWCGAIETIVIACLFALGVSLAANGIAPSVLQILGAPFRMMTGPLQVLLESLLIPQLQHAYSSQRTIRQRVPYFLGLCLPILILVGFTSLFVLANPNLRLTIGQWFHYTWNAIYSRLLTLDEFEIAFWAFAGATGMAFLFPYVADHANLVRRKSSTVVPLDLEAPSRPSIFYPAIRNTLWSVILLFAAYLIYEIATLWGREFPVGFYYAGYAHEGAFWLTVALACSTTILSLFFCRHMNQDHRMIRLRPLAWLWSIENLLLATAVFYRLWIYIDFNGMTRMRTIGLLGITAVVVGFLWVVMKIAKNRSFGWLVQRHTATLAIAIFLYAALPVDWLVHSWNSRQVLSGDYSPVVQITEHETLVDGQLAALTLIDSENAEIREGMRALAAQWHEELESRSKLDWTGFQFANIWISQRFEEEKEKLETYRDATLRQQRIQKFRDYAMQWY